MRRPGFYSEPPAALDLYRKNKDTGVTPCLNLMLQSPVTVVYIFTLLVDLSPVSIRQNTDLLLELLLLFFGLFLQVVLIWAHGERESVGVLLQKGGEG